MFLLFFKTQLKASTRSLRGYTEIFKDEMSLYLQLILKCGGGQSQDGGPGGRRIRISAQLGHLPGTGGGPRTPKGTEGTPSDWLGCGMWGGE